MKKLRLSLARFELYEQRIPDIFKLLADAYDDDNIPSMENAIDHLRVLVLEYLRCVARKVHNHEAFMAFNKENDEFLKDFLPRVIFDLDM